jgi:hypothetical protein
VGPCSPSTSTTATSTPACSTHRGTQWAGRSPWLPGSPDCRHRHAPGGAGRDLRARHGSQGTGPPGGRESEARPDRAKGRRRGDQVAKDRSWPPVGASALLMGLMCKERSPAHAVFYPVPQRRGPLMTSPKAPGLFPPPRATPVRPGATADNSPAGHRLVSQGRPADAAA